MFYPLQQQLNSIQFIDNFYRKSITGGLCTAFIKLKRVDIRKLHMFLLFHDDHLSQAFVNK